MNKCIICGDEFSPPRTNKKKKTCSEKCYSEYMKLLASEGFLKNSFKKGNWTKTKHQLNLKWSLEDYFNSNQKKEILMN